MSWPIPQPAQRPDPTELRYLHRFDRPASADPGRTRSGETSRPSSVQAGLWMVAALAMSIVRHSISLGSGRMQRTPDTKQAELFSLLVRPRGTLICRIVR